MVLWLLLVSPSLSGLIYTNQLAIPTPGSLVFTFRTIILNQNPKSWFGEYLPCTSIDYHPIFTIYSPYIHNVLLSHHDSIIIIYIHIYIYINLCKYIYIYIYICIYIYIYIDLYIYIHMIILYSIIIPYIWSDHASTRRSSPNSALACGSVRPMQPMGGWLKTTWQQRRNAPRGVIGGDRNAMEMPWKPYGNAIEMGKS